MKVSLRRVVLLFAVLLAVPFMVAGIASADAPSCKQDGPIQVEFPNGQVRAVGRASCSNHGAYVIIKTTLFEDHRQALAHGAKRCNQTKVCEATTTSVTARRGVEYCSSSADISYTFRDPGGDPNDTVDISNFPGYASGKSECRTY